MNAVSLFAGIGGFDLALERAGHTVTDAVEIDSHARKTLARHFPDTRLHEDIHDFTAQPAAVVVGGFPCQDYSVAGSRGGLDGDRGALWWQMHRIIAESSPTWVVGENVPGLVSSADGRDFATIIGSLVELGYGVVWRILDAQYFGVAQRRRRVFIVGHSGSEPRPEVLALAQGSIGDTQTRRTPGQGITGSLTGGSGSSSAGNPDDNRAQAGFLVADYNTPDLIRRLTPLECERLQGFPDDWTAGNSDTQRYRQLGNAVAVPVAEWIINRLTEETSP